MKVLNIQETADFLRVSVSTIRKLVATKKIKSFRVAYRLYFTEESIESFIREQEAESVQKTSYSQNEIKSCKDKKNTMCRPLPTITT